MHPVVGRWPDWRWLVQGGALYLQGDALLPVRGLSRTTRRPLPAALEWYPWPPRLPLNTSFTSTVAKHCYVFCRSCLHHIQCFKGHVESGRSRGSSCVVAWAVGSKGDPQVHMLSGHRRRGCLSTWDVSDARNALCHLCLIVGASCPSVEEVDVFL